MFIFRNSTKFFRHQSEILRVPRSLTSQASEKVKTEELSSSEQDKEWHDARPYSEIPRPGKLNLIRSFLPGGRFRNTSTTETVTILREELGDIFLMPGMFGKDDTVLITNPDHIEKVCRTEGSTPTRIAFETIGYYRSVLKKDFFGDTVGIISSQGEDWARQRKAINPIIVNPQNAKLYIGSLGNVVDEFVQRIRDIRDSNTKEVPGDFEEDIKRFAFESITSIALNQNFGLISRQKENPDAVRMFQNTREFLIHVFNLEMKPSLWKLISTPVFRRMMKCQDEVFDITSKFVSDAMIDLENKKAKGDAPSSDQEASVLEKLLKVDKKFAIVMTMDLLLTGVDTVSTIIIGTLLLLAKCPARQAILRQEILKVMPNKDTPLTEDSMKNMPYLRACIKEAIRYYGVLPALFRTTGSDLVLGGYQVPKGTNTILNTSLNLVDEKYFTRANEFVPERWVRKNSRAIVAQNIHPFSYVPFGFGVRNCIGKRIVDIEVEICITKLLRNFYVDFKYPVENIFKQYFANVVTAPLKIKFTDVPE